MNTILPFADRTSAGKLLARRLEHLRGSNPVILALPRGGVPVASPIADALDGQLDLLMVRKIGAPGHKEFAIGAIVDGASPQLVLNQQAMKAIAPGNEYVQQEMGRQLVELERRRRAYLGNRPTPQLAGRTVIIVDDGIATGSTIKAALSGIRRNLPARLILAVPVGPPDTIRELRALCDELVVLSAPDPFFSVGQHYRDFNQVTDSEVISLLQAAECSGPVDS